MKIRDVRCVLFDYVPPPGLTGVIARMAGSSAKGTPYLFLKIQTDEGVEGYSCQYVTGDEGLVQHIEGRIRPLLIGRDPTDVEALWQMLWRAGRITALQVPNCLALAAVDVCLWDILGKLANMPIYKLLGAYRHEIPAYASSQGHQNPEEVVAEAVRCVEQGYTAYKTHPFEPFRANAKEDIAICRALRKTLGEDVGLMHDPYSLYDREEALQVGRALDELNFTWFEEPMPEWDIEGYALLCDALTIPIVAPEILGGSLYGVPELILRRAADIIRGDVRLKGGITPLRKMAGLAEAFGMKIEIHATAAPLMKAANLHVMCAIKNTTYYEALIPQNIFAAGVVEDVIPDAHCNVAVPQKPGIGLEVDWAYIEKHKTYETPSL